MDVGWFLHQRVDYAPYERIVLYKPAFRRVVEVPRAWCAYPKPLQPPTPIDQIKPFVELANRPIRSPADASTDSGF
jgi:hypothetical protein